MAIIIPINLKARILQLYTICIYSCILLVYIIKESQKLEKHHSNCEVSRIFNNIVLHLTSLTSTFF